MHITFSPFRSDAALHLSRKGDVVKINRAVYDFSPLEEGDLLPEEAVGSEWIAGPVTREAGEICFSVRLPHGAQATKTALFPTSVHITQDGPIALPAQQKEHENARN